MHLDHKIPWNLVASHFKYSRRDPTKQSETDIFVMHSPARANDLNHFLRVFLATIREFSSTLRRKVKEKYQLDTCQIPDSEPIFSNTLLSYPEERFGLGPYERDSAYNNPFCKDYQSVEYWISRATESGSMFARPGKYGPADGDLADAVKMLFISAAEEERMDIAEEAIKALFRLFRHPKIPVINLQMLGSGHWFGFELVAQTALVAYLVLNITDAVFERSPPAQEYPQPSFDMKSFQRFADNAVADNGHPTQNLPHRAFWFSLGDSPWGIDWEKIPDPLRRFASDDLRARTQKYLKNSFRILYVYDAIMRDSKGDKEVDERWANYVGNWMKDR